MRCALVATYTKPALELWLNHHVDYGKKLAELVIKQAPVALALGAKSREEKIFRRGRIAGGN